MLEQGAAPGLEASADAEKDESGAGRWLLCAKCGQKVTRAEDAIEVGGRHLHARLNPAGVLFAFGCFKDARCAVEGTPSTEASWFPPAAWQYAHCLRCGAHLGWYFSEGFYGLVMERLSE